MIATSSESRSGWVAYAAAAWAFIFTFLHVAWAAGWYLALPRAQAQLWFARRGFWLYDVVVVGACALAVLVALALVRPWGRRVPRTILRPLLWSGTGLLVLRSGAAGLQAIYLIATGQYVPEPMQLYEIWFALGAIAFGASVWRYRETAL